MNIIRESPVQITLNVFLVYCAQLPILCLMNQFLIESWRAMKLGISTRVPEPGSSSVFRRNPLSDEALSFRTFRRESNWVRRRQAMLFQELLPLRFAMAEVFGVCSVPVIVL